ncbi:hypothetical protein [Novipirellula aureliae]|nr:hypothetical protein [Novipirellula aureliae]
MLVVSVNGLPRHLWSDLIDDAAPVETVFIDDVIPHVDKTYRTIANRNGRILAALAWAALVLLV